MPAAPGVRCKGCRKIHAGIGLCPTCLSLYEQARGTKQARGYDAGYYSQLRAEEYRKATRCTECGEPFTPSNPKTGGHSTPIRRGGKGSKVVAHCRRCNYGWRRTNL